ncbi:DUF4230 domain-containing protein [Capnocytophaga sp. oral taxon 338]|uniref:DUF4230 domain-containing protein n=1 Tax=Capnocytophaga sp. oral taxon 338 TaxID=710239 RepID=UPI000202B9B1|nr:DUF4230 domain-containing protein [Capnocytophaga sp. oral taxon 338]EGD34611.1 hypothetical protein HMPREF9071_0802 [Capnocytophaga sp. oral taxon 338 str. F0234]
MKKLLLGLLLGVIVVLLWQYFFKKEEDHSKLSENTTLIEQEIKNVGKLVVTEGYFSEILTYQDAKKYLNNWISFDKKALVVINAEATISYDLHQLRYEIDEPHKVVRLLYIPKEELKIYPKIQYYDIEESSFNPFTAEDHNKIHKRVIELISRKIEQSSFRSNAQNRLLTELSKIFILTHSMGWILEYTDIPIEKESDLLVPIKK